MIPIMAKCLNKWINFLVRYEVTIDNSATDESSTEQCGNDGKGHRRML